VLKGKETKRIQEKAIKQKGKKLENFLKKKKTGIFGGEKGGGTELQGRWRLK